MATEIKMASESDSRGCRRGKNDGSARDTGWLPEVARAWTGQGFFYGGDRLSQ